MSKIQCIADLAGLDLGNEGWGICVVHRVYFHVGSGIREVGWYRSEQVADVVIKDHPLGAHLVKVARLAIVNIDGGFDLAIGNKFSFGDKKVLPCAHKAPVAQMPRPRFRDEDGFVPRHPYHHPDESEGPDPTTHPSWSN